MPCLKVIDVLGTCDIGSRHNGKLLREQIEDVIRKGMVVSLDFTGINLVTQSFIDEAVGVLIREIGPSFTDQIRFANCDDQIKSIIRLVATYSLRMFARDDGSGTCGAEGGPAIMSIKADAKNTAVV